jgi:hypothetical protein
MNAESRMKSGLQALTECLDFAPPLRYKDLFSRGFAFEPQTSFNSGVFLRSSRTEQGFTSEA